MNCVDSSPTIANNDITLNIAVGETGSFGGGIYCSNSSAMIVGNTISYNSTDPGMGGPGGGVYCEQCPDICIANNVIGQNVAAWGGGVCFIKSSGIMSNNTIVSNAASAPEYGGVGGGIYCYNSGVVIRNNFITANESTHQGGGIFSEPEFDPDEPVRIYIINNQIDHNSAPLDGGAIFCESPCVIGSNTIVENGSLEHYGYAVQLPISSWLSGDVFNNIIAFNFLSGICGGENTALTTNDVSGNSGDDYGGELDPEHDIIPAVPPKFAEVAVRNYHLQPDSECINAGSGGSGLDIDGENRVCDSVIDIGADENCDCEWYKLTLSSDQPGMMNQLVTVTANVKNYQDQNVGDIPVYFTITEGTITEVNGVPLPPGSTAASGQTDPATGNATIKVTRPNAGKATVTAKVNSSCGIGDTTRSTDVILGVKAGFIADLCYEGAEGIRTKIDNYLRSISTHYEWVGYATIDTDDIAVPGFLDQFNTIFLAMLTSTLSPEQRSALNGFVNSRRDKRIVLVGDYNPYYDEYNDNLNTIANALGIASRFSNGALYYDYSNTDQLCPTEQYHYLMTGVVGLHDWTTSPFQWGWQGLPVAYIRDLWPDHYPWIITEDTQYFGSRVLVHDTDLMNSSFGYDYPEMRDRNFRFVYNLCAVFPE